MLGWLNRVTGKTRRKLEIDNIILKMKLKVSREMFKDATKELSYVRETYRKLTANEVDKEKENNIGG